MTCLKISLPQYIDPFKYNCPDKKPASIFNSTIKAFQRLFLKFSLRTKGVKNCRFLAEPFFFYIDIFSLLSTQLPIDI